MTAPITSPGFHVGEIQGVQRAGLKGRDAARLLGDLGIALPPGPNQVAHFREPCAGRCLRLGNTEFLIEQDVGDSLVVALEAALHAKPAGTLGALRQDRSLLLAGDGLFPALRQVSAFDFESPRFTAADVVMTLMAGIGVTFVREPGSERDTLRLWCDPGYGDYLLDCLVALGGQTAPDFPLSHRESRGSPP